MFKCHGSFHHLKNNSLKYLTCNTEKTQNHTLNKNLIIKQICMDKLHQKNNSALWFTIKNIIYTFQNITSKA
ncbi:hypothetical protein ECDEC1E_1456 [Escherichia coli DEC1E]|nr:hypothetical protein ECDEC1E_1456 [Escherichia coli DEC1E]